ncbi:plasmid stability protein [Sphingomonas vulcanisoli]|uniref:Plasmid stability protein n=1 Tax=Sphingomonas vulcanisoli TaxID=1658060 RepID=A0ABX0TQF5_9SPHN|nr:plasmid stabilization protein [Sphingomonas vulcanisoli]NIJ06830.1 plasmid stability protein [Sphingomonas vulcanisoli]
MASLTIRNIPDDVKRRFHQRAAANGRSMEEEGRQLIIGATQLPKEPARKGMFDILFEASRPGLELPIPPRSRARIPDLSDE